MGGSHKNGHFCGHHKCLTAVCAVDFKKAYAIWVLRVIMRDENLYGIQIYVNILEVPFVMKLMLYISSQRICQ